MTISKRDIAIALPSIGIEEWEATKEVFESGWITQGPKVAAFEKEFAELHGAKHGIAVTSCTTGLHLALAAMEIGPGDEVVVPAFTWVATANVVKYCGATPVFCDVDTKTNNIDLSKLKDVITNKTKVIIPVHLFGLCVDVEKIKKIAPGVKILEDAACSAGASVDGKFSGTLGDAGVFSLHPRKSISTGEGGMILTNDSKLADLMNKLRNHGAEISEEQRHKGPKPYLLPDFNHLGFNYRMTDIQGAVGLVQIKKLNALIEEREKWARFYLEELASIDWLELVEVPANYRHAWQAFVTYVNPEKAPYHRNEIMEKLKDMGISTRPGTHAVHMLNYYAGEYNLKPEDFPGAKLCDENTMAIPLHNRMSEEDFKYVVQSLREI